MVSLRAAPLAVSPTDLVISATPTFAMSHHDLGISPGWLLWSAMPAGELYRHASMLAFVDTFCLIG
jgi:hypothetical protein